MNGMLRICRHQLLGDIHPWKKLGKANWRRAAKCMEFFGDGAQTRNQRKRYKLLLCQPANAIFCKPPPRGKFEPPRLSFAYRRPCPCLGSAAGGFVSWIRREGGFVAASRPGSTSGGQDNYFALGTTVVVTER